MIKLMSSSKGCSEGQTVAVSKHIGTQTTEKDIKLGSRVCKKNMKDYFHKKNCSKSRKTKFGFSKKVSPTYLGKPRYQSTPLRVSVNHEESDSDCEVVLERSTGIGCRNVQSLKEGSDPINDISNRMCKSDSILRSLLSSNPSTSQILSCGETFKSVDSERFSETTNQNDGVCVAEKTRCSENTKEKQCMSSPPIVPVVKSPSFHLKGPPNAVTVTADVHSEELENIDIDNSFIDCILNRNTVGDNANDGSVLSQNTLASKRDIQNSFTCSVNKKQRQSVSSIYNENNERKREESVTGILHSLRSSNPSTSQILSLDETFKSVDSESFSETTIQNDGVCVAEKKRCSENTKEKQCMSSPPIVPVVESPSFHLKVPPNAVTVTADVHSEELENIDIDNSFIDSILNRNTVGDNANDGSVLSQNTSASKRHIQNSFTCSVNKKQRQSVSLIYNENNERKREESVRRKLEWSKSQNFSANAAYENNIRIPCDEDKIVCESDILNANVNKNVSLQSKCVELGKQGCPSMENKKSSDFSESERMCRLLIDDAKKSVNGASKLPDPPGTISEMKQTFVEHGSFFGLSTKVKELFAKFKGINKLYDWQEECLNLQAIKEKKNLVYAPPTSSGKTLVAEILMLRELLCYQKNALFILPNVSIVQEKVHSLSPFAIGLEFFVEEYAAGRGQYPPKKHRHQRSVYVATIEKAHSLINSFIETKRLSEIGLVVVDELHLLGEGDRGATLECLLTKLLFSNEKIHIVGMSATIGNLKEVAKFLQAEIYIKKFLPVRLEEYVKCKDTLWAVQYNEEEMLTRERTVDLPYTSSMKQADPDKVCSLVLEIIPEHSCLVFCPSKSDCENVASMFSNIMPRDLLVIKTEKRKALCRALLTGGRGSCCPVLQKCIPFGVAYHHSGLTGDERRLLEEAYRIGTLNCICCTSTLAAGVNLPAKRVILIAPFVDRNFISFSQYKQMVGRAGRAGFDDIGESILVCQMQDMPKVRALLSSNVENAVSQLHLSESRGLQSFVLGSVDLGIANCRRGLHKMVTHTLLHVQRTQLEIEPNELIDKTVAKLFKLNVLRGDSPDSSDKDLGVPSSSTNDTTNVSLNISHQTEMQSPTSRTGNILRKHLKIRLDSCLKTSKLGRAAIKGSIDLVYVNDLYKDLLQAQNNFVLISYLHLLYLVTPYDMLEQIKMDPEIYYHVFNNLRPRDYHAATVIGINVKTMLEVQKGSKSFNVPMRVVHRFYITLILNDLWNQDSIWQVSHKYKIPRGTIQYLMTSASSFASSILHFCEEFSEFQLFKKMLTELSQRLTHCCSAELTHLMELPAVKMGRARQLYKAGYKTLTDVANADVFTLVTTIDHLPKRTADQIICAAKHLLWAKVRNLEEDAEDVMEGFGACKE